MKVVAGIFWRSLTVALTSAALIFLVGCDDSKPTTKVGDEIPTGVKDKYATIEEPFGKWKARYLQTRIKTPILVSFICTQLIRWMPI